MPAIGVDLGSRSYSIVVEPGLLASAADHILRAVPKPTSAFVITHPRLARLYSRPLVDGLAGCGVRTTVVTIPPGERHKTLRTVERVYQGLLDGGADRRSLVVTLGGGMLGDLAGFAASTYLRGIPFVQVPTTLLAQVDASVGGKTGVDLPGGKNLVGVFAQPRAVLIDPDTLRTLPARELRSGMAEVVKHGIISNEPFFRRVAADLPRMLRRDPQALCFAIVTSCQYKASIVRQDETEQGRRAVLNYGHTVGHALEALTGYRRYKHGEAVAIGMVSAALIAEEVGMADAAVTADVRAAVSTAGLPGVFPPDVAPEAVVAAISRDKKAVAGRATFILARRIGDAVLVPDVPDAAVIRALQRQRAA